MRVVVRRAIPSVPHAMKGAAEKQHEHSFFCAVHFAHPKRLARAFTKSREKIEKEQYQSKSASADIVVVRGPIFVEHSRGRNEDGGRGLQKFPGLVDQALAVRYGCGEAIDIDAGIGVHGSVQYGAARRPRISGHFAAVRVHVYAVCFTSARSVAMPFTCATVTHVKRRATLKVS